MEKCCIFEISNYFLFMHCLLDAFLFCAFVIKLCKGARKSRTLKCSRKIRFALFKKLRSDGSIIRNKTSIVRNRRKIAAKT